MPGRLFRVRTTLGASIAAGIAAISGRSRSAYVAAFSMALSASVGLQGVASAPARAAGPEGPEVAPQAMVTVVTTAATEEPTPSAEASPAPTRPPADVEVPILYYHRVEGLPHDFWSWGAAKRAAFLQYDVLPVAFAAQLDWLRERGYTTILPRDLIAHWTTGAPLPVRPVIITFDDGTHDWIRTVLPLLSERGMIAEFYVNIRNVYRGALSFDDLKELAAAGNGIGAHGVDHVQIAGFASGHRPYDDDRTWKEIAAPKVILEREVGVVVDSMAYVGGGFDAALLETVRMAGYTSARTIMRGNTQHPDAPYELRIVRVGIHDDVLDLRRGTLAPALPRFSALLDFRAPSGEEADLACVDDQAVPGAARASSAADPWDVAEIPVTCDETNLGGGGDQAP